MTYLDVWRTWYKYRHSIMQCEVQTQKECNHAASASLQLHLVQLPVEPPLGAPPLGTPPLGERGGSSGM